jgi:hypothetical protein
MMIQQMAHPADGALKTGYPQQIDDLDISATEDGYIIYQPERDYIHFLNPTAVLILELCNGKNSQSKIADLVKQAYGLGDAPSEVVRQALMQLTVEGLLRQGCPLSQQ